LSEKKKRKESILEEIYKVSLFFNLKEKISFAGRGR
jgi:hypothetical protein